MLHLFPLDRSYLNEKPQDYRIKPAWPRLAALGFIRTDMVADFIINVAAGVFLSVVVWFLFTFLQPRYLAWRYKAPQVRGHWSFHDSEAEDAPAVGTAEIKQAGELIDPVVTRTKSRKGKAISRTFNYKGNLRDGAGIVIVRGASIGWLYTRQSNS